MQIDRAIRFGRWPNLAQPWADALALARYADATEWNGVYIAAHSMGDAQRFCRNLAILFTAGRRSEVR